MTTSADHHLAPRFVFDDRVVATGWLAVVLWPLGEVDQAARLLDSALSLARQSGHLPTIAWAHAYTCRFAGICRKPGQARPHAEELLGLAREHGLPMRLADGSFYHGWARWCAGDGRWRTQKCARVWRYGMRCIIVYLHRLPRRCSQSVRQKRAELRSDWPLWMRNSPRSSRPGSAGSMPRCTGCVASFS